MSQSIFISNQFDAYPLRKATPSDADAVIRILKDAAVWIQAKGISQWEYLRAGGEDNEIIQDIHKGTTYVAEAKNGQIKASFNLSDIQNAWDLEMWGEKHDHAYYLHRLVVHPEYRHRQLGKKLLAWIDQNLGGNNSCIRLDCVGRNDVLNKFYQQAGYTYIGKAGVGEDAFSLYEKRLLRSS
ncbi:GNAT family N-acetyltransferase [Virgibacillus sp. LDC-1]|uniref:GNAT family N-acetyltransferase n=1 Tax=Virgibacillus sp. LDC-1 TaxID=3039856 RepID=UPI0024DEAD21|nr:GNAT family N-acetyltransferase [Virgibacillus sp. LDC-1]